MPEVFGDTVAVKVASFVGTVISNDLSLMSAGLDSISTTELAQSLSAVVGSTLPSTLVFDHPSVSAIVSAFAPVISTAGHEKTRGASAELDSTTEGTEMPRTDAFGLGQLVSGILYDLQSTVVALESPLLDVGLDSISALELTNAMMSQLKTTLPSTLIFDHPTISSLAQYMASAPPSAMSIGGKSRESTFMTPDHTHSSHDSHMEKQKFTVDPCFSFVLPGSDSGTSVLTELATCGLVTNSTIPIARANA